MEYDTVNLNRDAVHSQFSCTCNIALYHSFSLLQGPRLCQASVMAFHSKILPPYGPVPAVERPNMPHAQYHGEDHAPAHSEVKEPALVVLQVNVKKFNRILGPLRELIARDSKVERSSVPRLVC